MRTSVPFPEKFDNVSAAVKANVYFDGKVVSHTLHFADGSKKTLGLIYPGTFKFDTGAPERMQITAGSCRVKLAGEKAFKSYPAGSSFDVPGKSAFEIAVDDGIAQYICSFLSG
jgi:uncharacterized protein YaiE (UPF0345 family)